MARVMVSCFGFSSDSSAAEEACPVLAHPEMGTATLPLQRKQRPLALRHQKEIMVIGNRQIPVISAAMSTHESHCWLHGCFWNTCSWSSTKILCCT